ncbi:MAG TPA: ABC transporter substrate-binding protein [Acidimicrobiales bacterium]|nr:ABC transporter substrate-binding protein [Acidimicrobiales bacterium]
MSAHSYPRRHRRAAVATLAGAVALTPVLAACGSGSSANTGSGNPAQTLEIGMWTNPPAISAVQHIDAEFKKLHPNITIKLQDAPTANNAWNTLSNTLLSGKTVDVLANYGPTPSVNEPPKSTGIKPSGMLALMEAGDLVNQAHQPYMKYFSRSEQETVDGYKGAIDGLQSAEYSYGGNLWYKTAIMRKYHLAIPTTFSQLLSECATLKKHGVTPFFVAGNSGFESFILDGILGQLVMQGKPSSASPSIELTYEKDFLSGKLNYNSPIFKKAVDEYEQLMKGNIEPDASGVVQLNAPGEWAAQSNNYAFLVDGTWDGPVLKQANPKLKFGDFTLPGTNDPAQNREMIAPDLTWTIPKSAPNIKMAEEWISFFAKPSNYAYWVKSTGSLSLEPGIKTNDPWMGWDNAHLSKAMELFGFDGWLPSGASAAASGPQSSTNLVLLPPFGKKSVSQVLNADAAAYTKAIKH